MKLAVNTEHRIGVVEGDQFYDVTDAVPGAGPAWPPMYMNRLIAEWAELGPKVAAARKAASPVALSSMKLLPPNPCPVHVIAAPANYRKHIGEIGARSVSKGRTAEQQGFFMKSTASLVGAGGALKRGVMLLERAPGPRCREPKMRSARVRLRCGVVARSGFDHTALLQEHGGLGISGDRGGRRGPRRLRGLRGRAARPEAAAEHREQPRPEGERPHASTLHVGSIRRQSTPPAQSLQVLPRLDRCLGYRGCAS